MILRLWRGGLLEPLILQHGRCQIPISPVVGVKIFFLLHTWCIPLLLLLVFVLSYSHLLHFGCFCQRVAFDRGRLTWPTCHGAAKRGAGQSPHFRGQSPHFRAKLTGTKGCQAYQMHMQTCCNFNLTVVERHARFLPAACEFSKFKFK